MEPYLYRIWGNLENIGNLTVFKTLKFSQNNDSPGIRRELIYMFPYTFSHLLADKTPVNGGLRVTRPDT